MATKVFTLDDVKPHNKEGDAWIVVNGLVLDVTKFVEHHPGGAKILMRETGKDASEKFEMFHKVDKVLKDHADLVIGRIGDSKL